MKLKLNLLGVDVQECTRRSEARPFAMAPVMESVFFQMKELEEGELHTHVMKITHSGFQFLAELETTVKDVAAAEGLSHFAFRNSLIVLFSDDVLDPEAPIVTSEQIKPIDVLNEQSAQHLQIFLALYLRASWNVTDAVAININRLPLSHVRDEGKNWTAFAALAVLPCEESEWIKCLDARKQEVFWAEQYLKNKQALADVTTAALLKTFNNLH